MYTADQLLNAGCERLKCEPGEVTALADVLETVLDESKPLTRVGLALQIIVAGGVEAHLQTMNPESEWALVIYPQLKEALSVRETN